MKTMMYRQSKVIGAQARYEYVVEGFGDFPLDMLRYDCAWPKEEKDAGVAQQHERGLRRVRLTGTRPPTEARWHSFLWKVRQINELGEVIEPKPEPAVASRAVQHQHQHDWHVWNGITECRVCGVVYQDSRK